jgi:hypothetical protein
MALITAETMILSSLRRIGEKSVGGTLATAEQTDYLYDLNAWLDSQGLNRLLIPHLYQDSFSLTSSDGVYTIGPGGDFSTVRPLKIEQAFTRDSNNLDRPIFVINREQYDRIPDKTADGGYPAWLFYDPTVPLGRIHLYVEPTSGLTLYLDSWRGLQKFGGIDVPLQLPPGYQLFIESNFAIYVAGGFTNVSQEVAKVARDSRADVMAFNAPTGVLQLEVGGRRRYDINSDT